jgi:hypothetical protein
MKMCSWRLLKSNFKQLAVFGSTLALTAFHFTAFAQDGMAGINEANQQVRSYFGAGTQLMYAIGALVGLIGAVKVYQKWNAGDQDTGKVAAAWFGSCIFLVVVATVIQSFFGV